MVRVFVGWRFSELFNTQFPGHQQEIAGCLSTGKSSSWIRYSEHCWNYPYGKTHTSERFRGSKARASILCLHQKYLLNNLEHKCWMAVTIPKHRKHPATLSPSNFTLFNPLSLAVACLQAGVLMYCDSDPLQPLLIHTVFSIRTTLHHNRTVILKGN